MPANLFHRALELELPRHGGLYNAHAHVDRYATLEVLCTADAPDHENIPSRYPMWDKVDVTERLHHGVAYTRASLSERMHRFLAESEACGVTRVDSFVDVTTDVPLGGGLGAVEVALEAKRAFVGRVDFRVGAYTPFGFRAGDEREIELFKHAITLTDFIGTSPERDDPSFYRAEAGHIGLRRHLEWTLDWAVSKGKPIHYHLDQQVNPHERGTEALVDTIERSALRERIVALGAGEPFVWAVHCISPSTYAHTRREALARKLAALRIGVVCCPSAALSMRNLQIFTAPLHKSIADVLLLLEHGVRVRMGTDNVDDIFLPATALDPRHEVTAMANALRFYDVPILAKIACGKPLTDEECRFVREHLENERQYVESLRDAGPFPV